MRDPKRIRPFLDKLAIKWEEYPEWTEDDEWETATDMFTRQGEV